MNYLLVISEKRTLGGKAQPFYGLAGREVQGFYTPLLLHYRLLMNSVDFRNVLPRYMLLIDFAIPKSKLFEPVVLK